ncbi:hypothetical protein B0H19DRAFT_1062828 [Mycena capillaripes]|nr:hypothetical protein B0H19DRAFT_1062828 [Mycena capillaripes]
MGGMNKELRMELAGVQKSSSVYVASLQHRLDELMAEVAHWKQNEVALGAHNAELAREKQVLAKRVSRFPDRFETGLAKLSTQSLKEDGIISTEIRAVRKIIHAVTKGLNIEIKDNTSTRSAGRIIILKGEVAAQLQIVDAVKNANYLTVAAMGQLIDISTTKSRFITVKEKLHVLGLTQAPNHTSEEQMAGWLNIIQEMDTAYNASPLGRMMTTTQRTLFQELKKRIDREIRFTESSANNTDSRNSRSCRNRNGTTSISSLGADNDAAANSGSAAAKERAEQVSSHGGVRLCGLMGMLLNNKDDKKGQQDSHGVYFCAHEHIGFALRFPDTSNTRYQCFSEVSVEVIVNLIDYRRLMQFIRDRKMSLAFNHLEKNIWTAINDLRTIIELIIMLWYGQNFSHPVMTALLAATSTVNLRPAARKEADDCPGREKTKTINKHPAAKAKSDAKKVRD